MRTTRLPASKRLAIKILAARKGRQTLSDSVAFLLAKRSAMATFAGISSFVLAEGPERIPGHSGCEHHMLALRSHLARELWSRQLYIGVSVLDDLLFDSVAHDTTTNPVLRVLEIIRDEGLHHPGMVVFPIHSFGMLSAGFVQWLTGARLEYISSDFGIAISPQTNDMTKTLEFLERVRARFGIKKPINEELIYHWYRSRSTRWMASNPLLVVKAQSFPGGYYENQVLLVSKLRACAATVSMLACLQPRQDLIRRRASDFLAPRASTISKLLTSNTTWYCSTRPPSGSWLGTVCQCTCAVRPLPK
ncbi:hypothetical protein WME98_24025 [Sorangium sp. So ce296]|uniref:hypothetical protein n=1 Tax=Sorangium sp. So ce296 TaxID=3133296 RepID=UPI003F62490B